MKILVTGAEGFIGSHLTERLLELGHQVRAFVFYNFRDSSGWLEQAEARARHGLDLFRGDIRDPHGVRRAMEGSEAVLHLAALIGIPYSYHSPDSYVDTNIKGTLNVLQAAREMAVKRVVHTSTSEVYGTARNVPIRENHVLQGQSPYSASKIGADHLALSFHHSFGLPVSVLRPFNTYGPRQSARAVIPTIITQILMGKKDISLGSLHPTRDFVFIEDTVHGFIRALESPQADGEVVHLGTGYEISVGQLAQLVATLMETPIKILGVEERFRPAGSEVDRLVADSGKAKKLLQWEPKYQGPDGLKQGLQKTIDWFRHPENYRCYQKDYYVL